MYSSISSPGCQVKEDDCWDTALDDGLGVSSCFLNYGCRKKEAGDMAGQGTLWSSARFFL